MEHDDSFSLQGDKYFKLHVIAERFDLQDETGHEDHVSCSDAKRPKLSQADETEEDDWWSRVEGQSNRFPIRLASENPPSAEAQAQSQYSTGVKRLSSDGVEPERLLKCKRPG